MNEAGVAQRVLVAFASSIALAVAHLVLLYLYLLSGGSVSREVFLGVGPWFAAPAGALLLAGLVLAASRKIRYAPAFLGVVLSALTVTILSVPLALMDTPRELRDDRFEPNTVFLVMPVVQVSVIVIALVVVVAWHLLKRRKNAVA